jgi:hypothetical protein
MSSSQKLILPSELVDRIFQVSDLLKKLGHDLNSALESQSSNKESPVQDSLRNLLYTFDAALGLVNSSLDGKLIDMDSFLQVKSKANHLKDLWLKMRVRKHEAKALVNVNTSSSTPNHDHGSNRFQHQSGSNDSDASSLTDSAASQDHLSGQSGQDELHAPSFPLFHGPDKRRSNVKKVVKVVTPASTHEMVDLTGRRARMVSYTKPESVKDVIVVDDDEDEDEDSEAGGGGAFSPVVPSEISARIKAVRMIFRSEQNKRHAARSSDFSTPPSTPL